MSSDRARHREPLDVQTEAPDPPIGEHDHKQRTPRPLIIAVCLLLACTAFFGWRTYSTEVRLGDLEDYIAGRGQARDAENERLNERIDQAVCDVLDQLPAGGLFDPIRAQYGCGPGIPIELLSPEAAQNLADIAEQGQAAPAASVTPEPTTEALPPELDPQPAPGAQIVPSVPPVPTQAAPQPAPTTPVPQPAPVTPAPVAPTTPPPIVDLGPVADTVCGLLRVCL